MEKRIFNELKTIFLEVIGTDTIDINSNRKNISKWDSMAHIDLISHIEEKYEINFNLDQIIEFNNIKDIMIAIENKIKR
ncbi:MAG: acyl carrier protein [Campylobacterota bacterium]|nr:acyl carrier protein [Campylobacterota bacterium]